MNDTSTFVAYAQRGRNAWWRYLVGFCLAVLLSMVVGVVIVTALSVSPFKPADFARGLQDTSRPVTFYLLNGALFGLMVVGFWLAIGLLHGKRFTDIIGRWRWRRFGAGVVVWGGVLVVASLVDYLIAPKGFAVTASHETPGLVLAALVGLAVQTFAEEFVFRGYVTQGLLLALKRPLPAAVVSGLLFGALHIPNGTPQAVSAVIFGVLLALIAIRSGGLAVTFGMHLVNNLFGAAVVVSSGDVFKGAPGLFTQTTPHLMWWDVAFGSVALALVAWFFARPTTAGESA